MITRGLGSSNLITRGLGSIVAKIRAIIKFTFKYTKEKVFKCCIK